MEDKTPEEVYEDFWRPILEKDGELDMDQLKKELADFSMLMEMVPKVYCEVTGDRVSNPLVVPEQVIAEYEEHIEETVAERILERRADAEEILRRRFREAVKLPSKTPTELKEGQCSNCGSYCTTIVKEKNVGGGIEELYRCNDCGWFTPQGSITPKVKKVGSTTTIDEDMMNVLID